VVAIHELAEVVVIANGVRAGRRRAFGPSPVVGSETATDAPMPALIQIAVRPEAACTDGCCDPSPDGPSHTVEARTEVPFA
jgi:cation-transporting ATPase G